MIKALFKIVVGLALCAGGIALECMWLAFCFGTVLVGIVLLIWFPLVLLLPFTFVSITGWRLLKEGFSEINPPNLRRISAQIAPIINAQICEIEQSGARTPLDERVLKYVGALAIAASRRNLSLGDVIIITSGFYTDPSYTNWVANLKHCVDYRDDLRGFWQGVTSMIPTALSELGAGQGNTLVRMVQKGI